MNYCSRSHRQWRVEEAFESKPPGSEVCVLLCHAPLLELFYFPSFLNHFSWRRVSCIRFLFLPVLDPVCTILQICLDPAVSQVLGCLSGSQSTSTSTAVSLPTLYCRLPEHKAVPWWGLSHTFLQERQLFQCQGLSSPDPQSLGLLPPLIIQMQSCEVVTALKGCLEEPGSKGELNPHKVNFNQWETGDGGRGRRRSSRYIALFFLTVGLLHGVGGSVLPVQMPSNWLDFLKSL